MIAMMVSVFMAWSFQALGGSVDLATAVQSRWLDGILLAVLILLAGVASHGLNSVAARTARQKSHVSWLPMVSTAAFAICVLLLHFIAWVPPEMAALLVSPVLLLPPLIYRVIHIAPPPEKSIFSFEETCLVQDVIFTSELMRQFRKRYPRSKVYLYRTHLPYKAGGVLLHSKERMPIPEPTHIEVTLDCPFTRKVGVLAEGKEIFSAYLSRRLPSGCVVSPLPHNNWDDWLEGLLKSEWLERIDSLDEAKPPHPDLKNLPYQLVEKPLDWQPIQLT